MSGRVRRQHDLGDLFAGQQVKDADAAAPYCARVRRHCLPRHRLSTARPDVRFIVNLPCTTIHREYIISSCILVCDTQASFFVS